MARRVRAQASTGCAARLLTPGARPCLRAWGSPSKDDDEDDDDDEQCSQSDVHAPVIPRGGAFERRATPRAFRLTLLAVLRGALRAVLGPRVGAVARTPADDLARALGVGVGRVLDAVLEVQERDVLALAAVDGVLLAVADADAVVARTAADGVAGGGGSAVDGPPRQRPQHVVARAAVGRVDAAVGEDPVVAGTAVLCVVAAAAGHQVVAAVAGRSVVARAAVEAVEAVAAAQRVVAAVAEQPVGPRTAVDDIGARTSHDAVVAGQHGDRVGVRGAAYAVVPRRARDRKGEGARGKQGDADGGAR